MVSLSVFLLLVFGAGGMGCQRCSCSGRVSILLLDDGCCNRGSDCMDVKVSPVSVADMVQNVAAGRGTDVADECMQTRTDIMDARNV